MMSVARTLLLLAAVTAGVGGCATVGPGAPVGEARFTEMFVEALRAEAPELGVWRSGPMELRIARDGAEFSAHLDAAYASYQAETGRLEEIIAQTVAATVRASRSMEAEIDATRIVPVIRDAGYDASVRQGGPASAMARDPYNAHLAIFYAEDTTTSIRYLTELELEALGFSRDGRRDIAVDNLRNLLPDVQAQGGEGSYILMADGTHEASLMLLDDIWTGGAMQVAGDFVVAVPSRDLLLVTGSDDARALSRMREIAGDFESGDPHFITNQLFIYRGGQFRPFDD